MDRYDIRVPKRAGAILVVDDDASVRDAMAEMLSTLGYATDTAENGREALARIERRRPTVILLDLKMPVMDGWQLLRELRAERATARIPVLILSAFGFEWEAELIAAQGYLHKPTDFETIRDTIRVYAGPPPARAGTRTRAKTRSRRT